MVETTVPMNQKTILLSYLELFSLKVETSAPDNEFVVD